MFRFYLKFLGFTERDLDYIALQILYSTDFIFTARKQSCGKVMFLHLSVSHSVHRGVYSSIQRARGVYPSMQWAGGCTPIGRHSIALGRHPPGRHAPGQTPPLGRHPPQTPPGKHPLGRHPFETATEAGGKHPTGMHSCVKNSLLLLE